MDSHDTPEQILNALEELQASPELQAEAQTNPESVLDKLRLSGVARHAVAFAIAAAAVAPVATHQVGTQAFWS